MMVSSCTKYDDSNVLNRLDKLEDRVTALETLTGDINANIASLQALVKALQGDITINTVSQTKDGYTITFSDGQTCTIKNGEQGADGKDGANGQDGKDGKDGKDGVNGQDGTNGTNGVDGKDGYTPVIAVKAEEGIYYWTVDGEWLLDENGEKIPVTSKTPQIKVENGRWMISYDGTNWSDMGPAGSGQASDYTITEDSNYVYIASASTGQTIKIAKTNRFVLEIATYDYIISANTTVEIPYSINGADGTEKVIAQSSDFAVSVTDSTICVKAGEKTDGEVIVMAVRNSDQAVCGLCLTFENGQFSVTTAETVSYEGGEVSVTVKTNVDYEVIIPEEAQSWIAIAPATKAVREDVVTFVVSANEGAARSAKVELKPTIGASLFVTIAQDAKPAPEEKVKEVTIAEFLDQPESDQIYRIKGTVLSIANTKYGNFTIADETGSVYIYGTENFSDYSIAIDGIVTVEGKRTVYTSSKGTVTDEMTEAVIVDYTAPVVTGYTASFDFTVKGAYDVEAPEAGKGTSVGGKTFKVEDVSITTDKGSAQNDARIWNSNGAYDFRAYKGSSITFSVPKGKVITKIVFTGAAYKDMEANTGTYAAPTWTGSANSVSFSLTATTKISTVVVSYE